MLRDMPDFPFVGLEFITEYLNPGNPEAKRMYTCSLAGCKSAWGNAEEMKNHLTGDTLKHCKNYLKAEKGTLNLQKDIVYNKCRDIFLAQLEENNGQKDFSKLKTVSDKNMYLELVNRPIDWSESKALQKADLLQTETDLTHYQPIVGEESAKNTIEAMDALQTKVLMNLDQIKAHSPDSEDLKELSKMCLDQMEVMMGIMNQRREPLAMQALNEKHMDLRGAFADIQRADEIARSHRRSFAGTLGCINFPRNLIQIV